MSLLELRDVSLSFGGVKALDEVTAGAEAGCITSLIGPNGAGKTTLMNVVCGIAAPAGGSVQFRDREVTGWRPDRIARLGMARTFQNLELFGDMTVRDNVLVGRHARMRSGFIAAALRLPRHYSDERNGRSAVEGLLERLDLVDVADEPAPSLPYGLQRRVELARALASEPALLLLDEPMAGLSSEETQEVAAVMRSLAAQGVAVLLVEHEMGTVMSISDHVLVLDRGGLLAEGTPADVQSNPDVIEAYLGEEHDEEAEVA